MAMAFSALIVLLSLFSYLTGVFSKPTNVTIDDSDVGPYPANESKLFTIGFFPPYNGFWSNQVGGQTFFEAVPPRTDSMERGTYTATTTHSGDVSRSIVIDFYGTDITAYFTLANDAFTECRLIVDSVTQQNVRHSPGSRTDDFDYRVPFVTFTGLPQSWHRLEIIVERFTRDRRNYVNFDYATFAYDPEIGVPTNPRADDSSAPPVTSVSSRGNGTQIAAIVSGVFGGCVVLAAIILVWYLRSRKKAPTSAVHSKVDVSNGTTQGSKGFSFRNTFSAFVTKRNATGNSPSTLPVSIPQYHPSNRYSTSSSTASSPKQPMYEEYGNANKWEDLTSIAYSPELRSMTAKTKPVSIGDARSMYTDGGRPDSLGLHLTNIPYEPAKTYQARSATISSQLLRSPDGQVSPRDLTAPYQYSIRQGQKSPTVAPLHAM
ncbi:hypothetical protein FA15DRAFT_670990 [Coprinopsis marcescibilis]|uniref:Uncharacterized protein n=1 Tax=Coprinopsis marcescibilis TaxID=230819 RepID=A0A5C3KQX3_COPMA|nr:hypothetical protein FA15DRAFT_670990 [Coprinopsis marcescibilis]